MTDAIPCPEPGVYENVPFMEYTRWRAMSASVMKQGRKSRNHISMRAIRRAYEGAHDDDSRSKALGRAVHTAVLEPYQFPIKFVVYDGRRQGKKWEAFEKANRDKDILTVGEYDQAYGMLESVKQHELAQKHLTGGKAEVSVVWDDHGVRCKARLDYLRSGDWCDLKSTCNIAPPKFGYDTANLNYDLQFGLYRRAVRSATGKNLPMYVVAVENKPWHDTAVYPIADDLLDEWEKDAVSILQQWRHCTETGHWPGMADDYAELILPAWAQPQSEPLALTFGGKPMELN